MEKDNCTGKLFLQFKKHKDGRTYLGKQHYRLPLQVLPPHYQDDDGTAYVYLLNPSGGVMQNDRLLTEIVLEEKANVFVTTPSANKFYKMENGHAEVSNIFIVKRKGILEYLPDHNIPFANSNTVQENIFYLNTDSVLMASEMITPGRTAKNEFFQYTRYKSTSKIYVEGKLIAYDRMVLEPLKCELMRLGLLSGFKFMATMYIYKQGIAELLKEKMPSKIGTLERIKYGITAVNNDLAVIKFLGNSVMEVQDALLSTWSYSREVVLGKKGVKIRKY